MNTRQTADGFILIPRSPRNIDRWICRSSIVMQLRSVYPEMTGRLLDVGCGRMPYRQEICASTSVTEYIGLDIDSAIVYDAAVKPDVTWDGMAMPFPDGCFDCAIATEVFEHAPDLDVLLRELLRVLRPGGLLFFTTPFFWPYHETPHDMQRWTSYGLKRHLQSIGYRDIVVTSIGNWHSAFAQFLGLWVARSPMPRAVRALLRWPVFWLQLFMMRFDANTVDQENSMPRMLAGKARS